MSLATYIDALERSARNLPSVLFEWEQIDEALQAHYAESLVELLATHAGAHQMAQTPPERAYLSAAWAAFVSVVVTNRRAIEMLMGQSTVADLLKPPSVSIAEPPPLDTLAEDSDCHPSAG